MRLNGFVSRQTKRRRGAKLSSVKLSGSDTLLVQAHARVRVYGDGLSNKVGTKARWRVCVWCTVTEAKDNVTDPQ